jgi:hypothetical protein
MISEQLPVGPFMDAAILLNDPKAPPQATCWGGKLAALWQMEPKVSQDEFMSMTLYRMPSNRVTPPVLQQSKDLLAAGTLTSLSGGWIFTERMSGSVANAAYRDPEMLAGVMRAMVTRMELVESNIRARLPMNAPPPKTGNGIFAVAVYLPRTFGYLFDVTMMTLNDRVSYGIHANSILQTAAAAASSH